MGIALNPPKYEFKGVMAISPPSWYTGPSRKQVYYAKAIGACFWFYLMYQLKEEGDVLLVKLFLVYRVLGILGNIEDIPKTRKRNKSSY